MTSTDQASGDENIVENNEEVTLSIEGETHGMPVYRGSIGPAVMDISRLYGQTGMFTYDPGFTSTASCESKITYIDGDAG